MRFLRRKEVLSTLALGGLALFAAEVALRSIRIPRDVMMGERRLFYRYDPILGWFPRVGAEGWFEASVRVHVQHNSLGFRDPEPGPKRKRRIAVVGDSFVWGYDSDQDKRVTERLQAALPEWQVLNLGVSGYGTDQELILLKQSFAKLHPDIVVLVFCANDPGDNSSNVRYEGYYKPYFLRDAKDRLTLAGVPVPLQLRAFESEHRILMNSRVFTLLVRLWYRREAAAVQLESDPTLALLAEVQAFVKSQGAQFVVAFIPEGGPNRVDAVREKAAARGIRTLDLGKLDAYPEYGHHWTPSGHQLAAGRIRDFLDQQGWLESRGH